ncbi:MAG: hypothetical protein K2X99_12730 [Gemmatimonadaceae bacterium]|nr:hypothetical protein [Gemmatimonadaceae bacterium]
MQPLVTFAAGGAAVHVQYKSAPTASEWIAAVRAAAHDPRSHAGMRILLDRRDVPPPSVTYVLEILGFVREFQQEFAKCEFALLVTDKSSLGMAHIGQALLEPMDLTSTIFTEPDAAMDWLHRRVPDPPRP